MHFFPKHIVEYWKYFGLKNGTACVVELGVSRQMLK